MPASLAFSFSSATVNLVKSSLTSFLTVSFLGLTSFSALGASSLTSTSSTLGVSSVTGATSFLGLILFPS